MTQQNSASPEWHLLVGNCCPQRCRLAVISLVFRLTLTFTCHCYRPRAMPMLSLTALYRSHNDYRNNTKQVEIKWISTIGILIAKEAPMCILFEYECIHKEMLSWWCIKYCNTYLITTAENENRHVHKSCIRDRCVRQPTSVCQPCARDHVNENRHARKSYARDRCVRQPTSVCQPCARDHVNENRHVRKSHARDRCVRQPMSVCQPCARDHAYDINRHVQGRI